MGRIRSQVHKSSNNVHSQPAWTLHTCFAITNHLSCRRLGPLGQGRVVRAGYGGSMWDTEQQENPLGTPGPLGPQDNVIIPSTKQPVAIDLSQSSSPSCLLHSLLSLGAENTII